ncbi:MAG TPA: hypothetical protein VIL19_00500 [Casimicrobiaceae bacterium]
MLNALRLPLIALATGATLSMVFVRAANAESCVNPQSAGAVRACAKAAEGPTVLRRFVERTAGIYNLSYYDFPVTDAVLVHSASDKLATMQASARR